MGGQQRQRVLRNQRRVAQQERQRQDESSTRRRYPPSVVPWWTGAHVGMGNVERAPVPARKGATHFCTLHVGAQRDAVVVVGADPDDAYKRAVQLAAAMRTVADAALGKL